MKLIIAAVMIFVFAGCAHQAPTELISREINFFLIEPNTFLSDFRNRDFSAFEPRGNVRPEEELILGEPISNWNPNDFRAIAEEINNIVWDETLNDWELQVIQFSWDCDIDNGPQDAYFSFYRVEETANNALLFVSKISIVPRRRTISVSQEVFSPLNKTPERVPIPLVEESLLEALSIAENNGGVEIRENSNNLCNISITFNTHLVQSDGWTVSYMKREGGPIEEFYINPTSGELLE